MIQSTILYASETTKRDKGSKLTYERKLGKIILRELHDKKLIEEGDKVIGDKLYGMDEELLSFLLERKIKPVLEIREGVHNKVRNKVRIEVRKIYQQVMYQFFVQELY